VSHTTTMLHIFWGSDSHPSFEELRQMAADYLGDLGSEENCMTCSDERAWLFITVRGAMSSPYRRVGPTEGEDYASAYWEQGRTRRIVIDTHQTWATIQAPEGDPATCALARGLAFCAAARWNGHVEFMPHAVSYPDPD